MQKLFCQRRIAAHDHQIFSITILRAPRKIKAAADAAKAKPGFQQTAADKLAIKQAADAGITEAKEKKKLRKKIVAETLTWSKNFDPSRHLIKHIRRT